MGNNVKPENILCKRNSFGIERDRLKESKRMKNIYCENTDYKSVDWLN